MANNQNGANVFRLVH